MVQKGSNVAEILAMTDDKMKILNVVRKLLWVIPHITEDILPIGSVAEEGVKQFEYNKEKYRWILCLQSFSTEEVCKIEMSILHYPSGVRMYRYTIYVDKDRISSTFNNFPERSPFVDTLAMQYTRALTELVHDFQDYIKCSNKELIEYMNHELDLKISYNIAGNIATESITLKEFLKLDDQDLNYNKTIYRITDPKILEEIKVCCRDKWMFGKMHRFETVKRNRLFYIENMDINDISEIGYDIITSLISENYKIINII